MRPGVADRLGVGFERMRGINPRLVYCSITGFGSTGPYADRPAFDPLLQALSGLMVIQGFQGPPQYVRVAITDYYTASLAAQAVLAALFVRERTGRGQKIECSLLETAVGFSSWTSAGWLADHVEPVRMGSRHRQNAPYQRFETQDGYMMIGAAGQSIWERCARALGHPEWLEDPRFGKAVERRKHRFALEKEITAVLATAPTAHWTKVLDEAGVPCGPVYTYEQLFADPQVVHRQMVVHADDAELGRVPHIRTPIRLSGSAVAVRRVAPRLGEHNAEILGGLGYDAAAIADLRRDRVI
jgi:crotonobetainyl-CoA:carnitine CoA-transferase CaiB-like acyl-CoA transferase